MSLTERIAKVEHEKTVAKARKMHLRTLILVAFAVGIGFQYFVMRDAPAKADSAARTDYAELVNSCYDHLRSADANALYDCIVRN